MYHVRAKPAASKSTVTPSRAVLQRQRASNSLDTPVIPSSVSQVLQTSGQALDEQTRARMEPRFGHDFSRVRIHTDARAAESAHQVNARAYTVGRDIVFNAGQYAPHSAEGQKILAHELAHVVQQSHAGSVNSSALSRSGDPFERAAHRAAQAVTAGRSPADVVHGIPPALQRDEEKKPTAEEHAAKSAKTGPTTAKTAYTTSVAQQAAIEKKGTPSTRVEVATPDKDSGVRGLSASDYQAEFKKCKSARAEALVPKAFLCTTQSIAAPDVASESEATFNTNVRVVFNGSGTSGKAHVSSASLPWDIKTAGFMDIDAIDTKMLTSYRDHEKGHRVIAVDIRNRLAKMFQADLDKALPTEKAPISKTGGDWGQKAVDTIIAKIGALTTQYETWYAELANQADSAWDTQEKQTLSDIAAAIKAKEFKPGSGPELKE